MKKEEKKWCKKAVCGCTHVWQLGAWIGSNAIERASYLDYGICKKCDYIRWVFSAPHHYQMYKKREA